MKKILLLITIICYVSFSQNFDLRSGKLNLNIKFPPPDSIKPQLKINKPPKLPFFPLYSLDTIYSIKGAVEDNSGKVKIHLDKKLKGTFTNGPFSFDVVLAAGRNTLVIDAFDRRENHALDTLVIIQDPKADISPPIIKILEPTTLIHRGIKVVPKYVTADSIFSVKGKVSDQSEILGVWVNKIPVDSLYEDEFQFTFYDGMPDSIMVEAADNFGNLTSEVYYAFNTETETLDSTVFKYHALLICIQDYLDKNIDPLEYPITNGELLKDILVKNYTFPPENIYFLKNPTRAQILSEFQKLRRKLNETDNLLIFYAGHGTWDEEILQGYWLPVDAKLDDQNNWLTNSVIKDYIKGIKTKHTLLIADACFAGNFFRSVEVDQNSEISFKEIYKYPSRRAITSGDLNSKVLDKSVFIKYLLAKLSDNGEKYWEAEKLFRALKDAVIYNTPNRQIPLYGIIEESGDEGFGDFIFIHK